MKCFVVTAVALMLGRTDPAFAQTPAGAPECEATSSALCIAPSALSVTDAEAALGEADLGWTASGDRLTVVARRGDGPVDLCCTLSAPMQRLGRSDVWAVTLGVPDLDRAVIDLIAFPPAAPGPIRPMTYRGPNAPPAPARATELSGAVVPYVLDSAVMGEGRKLSVYIPREAGGDRRFPVIYLADGAGIEGYARLLEGLVRQGRMTPAVIVGLHPGPDAPMPPDPWRMQEYVEGLAGGQDRFAAHDRFLMQEVLPLAERLFYASSRREDRVTAGQSNGGAWALSALRRHPETFRGALAMSPGGGVPSEGADLAGARLYVGVGTLEGGFTRHSEALVRSLEATGADLQFRPTVGGHGPEVWDILFADGIAWLFR